MYASSEGVMKKLLASLLLVVALLVSAGAHLYVGVAYADGDGGSE